MPLFILTKNDSDVSWTWDLFTRLWRNMCGPLSNLVELWYIVLRIMMMMMMMMKWIMEELLLDDIKVCLRHFYSDRNQHLTHLTHWGRDKMDAISQTTLWSAFSWMKNVWIPIEISLKFVPKGPIDNIPALVQTMAWRRPGDKPLSEPVMGRLPAHICVTRPQWVNDAILYRDYWFGMPKNVTRGTHHNRFVNI